MNRNFLGLLIVILLGCLHPAEAQQRTKVRRIGFLTGQMAVSLISSDSNIAVFREGLRDLGYTEGKDIIIEYRGAGGKVERMPELVAELIGLGADVIVTVGMPAVIAAKNATSAIPIVTANADILLTARVVASLARPDGNVTGSSRVDADFSAKRPELLKESFPKAVSCCVFFPWPSGGDEEELREIQEPGRKLAIQVQAFPTPDAGQFPGAFAEMRTKRADD